MHERDIEIPEPCHAAWDDMRPEDRGRFCFECQTRVHDLSAMTEREAERLLAKAERSDICVSYLSDAEGAIVFRPAPIVPVGRLRRLLPAAGLAVAAAACTPTQPRDVAAATAAAIETSDEPAGTPTATAAQPSVLAHPLRALPPQVPVRDIDEDIPCDGSMSDPADPPPPEVTPPVFTRTAGKPMIRRKGRRKPSLP